MRSAKRQGPRLFAAAVAVTVLTGCLGDRMGGGQSPGAAQPTAPPPDMAGRWTFSSGAASCAMNFGSAQGAEGAIRPEGGCPGSFYTSRKWTYEAGQLVIRDHNSTPLAQLRSDAPGRFGGQSTNGQPVTLVR